LAILPGLDDVETYHLRRTGLACVCLAKQKVTIKQHTYLPTKITLGYLSILRQELETFPKPQPKTNSERCGRLY